MYRHYYRQLTESITTPVCAKKTAPLQKKARGKTSFQSTKAGGDGLECRAKACKTVGQLQRRTCNTCTSFVHLCSTVFLQSPRVVSLCYCHCFYGYWRRRLQVSQVLLRPSPVVMGAPRVIAVALAGRDGARVSRRARSLPMTQSLPITQSLSVLRGLNGANPQSEEL